MERDGRPDSGALVPGRDRVSGNERLAAAASPLPGARLRTQSEVLSLLDGEPIALAETQAPQMVAFPVSAPEAAELQAALFDRFRIEIPVHRVDGRILVRLSVQAYTTDEDCDRLVEAMTTLLL